LLEKYGALDDGATEVNPKAPALPSNYLPGHPFPHGHPGLRDEEKVQGVKLKRDEATVRNEVGREAACIENMDRQIGRVLAKLEAMGELDHTYVIFTSDHGMSVGRHGLMGKQNLYEHTWRVPYLVKGPGIKPGSRAQGNIYLLDTLATLCDLAGIDPPATNEGVSFKSVLQGESETTRDVLYGVYCGGTKPGMRSVKKGDWKLIKYDVLDGKVRETQLFNLAENPDELLAEHHDPKLIKQIGNKPRPEQRNLADDPKFAKKRAELEALLLDEMKRLNDPYRLWDQTK
jgi:arylsulfatase A-like enzyme